MARYNTFVRTGRGRRLSVFIYDYSQPYQCRTVGQNPQPPPGLGSFRTLSPSLLPAALHAREVPSLRTNGRPARHPDLVSQRSEWVRFPSPKSLISKFLRKKLGSFRKSPPNRTFYPKPGSFRISVPSLCSQPIPPTLGSFRHPPRHPFILERSSFRQIRPQPLTPVFPLIPRPAPRPYCGRA